MTPSGHVQRGIQGELRDNDDNYVLAGVCNGSGRGDIDYRDAEMTCMGFTYRGEPAQKAELLRFIDETYAEVGEFDIEIIPRKHRYSSHQRGALHLACENLAVVLNSSGFDQVAILKPGSKIPWSKTSVKDKLYRPVLLAMTGKESTESMTSEDPSAVWESLSMMLADRYGVTVPAWPSRFGE